MEITLKTLLVALIAILIAILVKMSTYKSNNSIPTTYTTDRFKGGVGVGFGLDLNSGTIKPGFGVGQYNIISF